MNSDYISALQVFSQQNKGTIPTYQFVSRGLSHNPRFLASVQVKVFNKEFSASSSKECNTSADARQDAARICLEQVKSVSNAQVNVVRDLGGYIAQLTVSEPAKPVAEQPKLCPDLESSIVSYLIDNGPSFRLDVQRYLQSHGHSKITSTMTNSALYRLETLGKVEADNTNITPTWSAVVPKQANELFVTIEFEGSYATTSLPQQPLPYAANFIMTIGGSTYYCFGVQSDLKPDEEKVAFTSARDFMDARF